MPESSVPVGSVHVTTCEVIPNGTVYSEDSGQLLTIGGLESSSPVTECMYNVDVHVKSQVIISKMPKLAKVAYAKETFLNYHLYSLIISPLLQTETFSELLLIQKKVKWIITKYICILLLSTSS